MGKIVLGHEGARPHEIEKLRFEKQNASVADQVQQHVEGLRLQRYRPSCLGDAHCSPVDANIIEYVRDVGSHSHPPLECPVVFTTSSRFLQRLLKTPVTADG